jgi:flagellar biosynthesis protein FlhG
MSDQAAKLRTLKQNALPVVRAESSKLNIVAVTGSQAGVGTTTTAVNLGAVLADFGERVLIVDADQNRNDMLGAAGIRRNVENSLADVVAGKCGVMDAFVPGPLGTKLLVNSPRRVASKFTRHCQQRLLAALDAINNQFDVVVIDTGNGLSPWTRRVWLRSRLAVVVATTNESALMDAYAMLKLGASDSIRPNVGVLVNQAINDSIAADVQRRLSNSCQRFLSLDVAALPSLPLVDGDDAAGAPMNPRVWEQPDSPFGHSAQWLGRAIRDFMTEVCSDSCATACGAPARVKHLESTARC